MNREDAVRIINDEKLKNYNMNEERDNRENEVVLKNEKDKWIVYITDERASKIINSQEIYLKEEVALDDLIDRLRSDKILRNIYS